MPVTTNRPVGRIVPWFADPCQSGILIRRKWLRHLPRGNHDSNTRDLGPEILFTLLTMIIKGKSRFDAQHLRLKMVQSQA